MYLGHVYKKKKEEKKRRRSGLGAKLALGALYHRYVRVITITYRHHCVATFEVTLVLKMFLEERMK